ncbi:MAG: hypothetical protein V3W41_11605 [Planctomycetota bacterium]
MTTQTTAPAGDGDPQDHLQNESKWKQRREDAKRAVRWTRADRLRGKIPSSDLAQDVMLNWLSAKAKADLDADQGRARTRRITKCRVIDATRKKALKEQPLMRGTSSDLREPMGPGRSPAKLAQREELRRHLLKIIGQLSPKQQTLVAMKLNNDSWVDIAKAQDSTPDAVRASWRDTIRPKLELGLRDEGHHSSILNDSKPVA